MTHSPKMDESLKLGWKTKVVVIDFGFKYTKVGVSGDTNPRFILPSTLNEVSTKKSKLVLDTDDPNELYDNIADFFSFLYFKKLLINPKETKVVVVESLLGLTLIKKTIAKVLFSHLEVAAVLFVPSHMVALYTLAVPSAMSVDLGFLETTVIPVYEGYPVLHAYQVAPIGSRAIEDEVRRLLLEYYSENDPSRVPLITSLPNDILEEIKVALCFVAPLDKVNRSDKNSTRPPSVPFPIPNAPSLVIPGSVREDACEVLFKPDIDGVCLPSMILDAILKCPLDMRKILPENIVLFGGTAMIKGLRFRLGAEIMKLAASDFYKDKIFVKTVKFFATPSRENCTAWVGGSILGATDTVAVKALSKEEFNKVKDVPDWCNLNYTVKIEDTVRSPLISARRL